MASATLSIKRAASIKLVSAMTYKPASVALVVMEAVIFASPIEAIGQKLAHARAVTLLEALPSLGKRLGDCADGIQSMRETGSAGGGDRTAGPVVVVLQSFTLEGFEQSHVAIQAVNHV